jgi:hypothetical protein
MSSVNSKLLRQMGKAAYQVYAETMYAFTADDSSSDSDSDTDYVPSDPDPDPDAEAERGGGAAPKASKRKASKPKATKPKATKPKPKASKKARLSNPPCPPHPYEAKFDNRRLYTEIEDGMIMYCVEEDGCYMYSSTSFPAAQAYFFTGEDQTSDWDP